MEESLTTSESVSVSNWLITLIITAIPFIGFIMLFVWAFGDGSHPSKANWAKAMLLMFFVVIGFYLFIAIIFGVGMLGLFSTSQSY
ncbi:MAG: hypothetical protein JJU46_11595 [Balneolaceae bacterium]|nr:hypothetical protein [Balneolaceae bacterium]MCH8549738.1 hypothetical protein [Balneolaceae bacterium]